MLTSALKFLTSSSIFLALNGTLVVYFANVLYNDQISFNLYLAAFLSTFAVYNLNKITDKKEDSVNRPECETKGALYHIIPSVVAILVSLAIGIATGPLTLIILAIPLIIGFIYSFSFTKSIPRLKEIVGVKSFVVALSWSLTGAFLPETLQSTTTYSIVLIFSYIFVQILVNTIIFDTLDIKGDFSSGIKTIPVALGRKKTQKLLLIINSSLLIWLIYCVLEGFFMSFIPALAFGIVYGYAIILVFFKENCRRLHAEFMVDGQWLPIIILMKIFLR